MECCGYHTDEMREKFAAQPGCRGFVEAVYRRIGPKIRRDLVDRNRRAAVIVTPAE